MNIDQDLFWLVVRGLATLAAAIVVLFSAFSLLDKNDPGAIFPSNPKSLRDVTLGILIFAAYVTFFTFGAFAWFWFLPSYPSEYEGAGRTGTAVVVGVFGAFLLFFVAGRLNKQHWTSVGTAEILNDVRTHFRNLSGPREEVHVKIDALIEEIESGKKRLESSSDSIARERRINFLKGLKYGLYD